MQCAGNQELGFPAPFQIMGRVTADGIRSRGLPKNAARFAVHGDEETIDCRGPD